MTNALLTYCHISNQHYNVNGKIVENTNADDAQEWLKTMYTSLSIDYPKFYKMDGLAKSGFIAVELLKTAVNLPLDSDEIAVVFINKYSSLEADLTHQELIEKGSPSPAVFVYTLPNIVLGEIAIRNKWYGEQQFFIKNEWPEELMYKYILTIFELNKASQIIIGSVDYFDATIDAKLAVIKKEHFEQLDVRKEIKTIFD